MSVRRASLAAAAAALVLGGCAGAPGPREYLSTAPEAVHAARGGWVMVVRRDPDATFGTQLVAEGELLAAGADTLHVLTRAGPLTVVRAPRDRVTLIGEHNRAGERAFASLGLSFFCLSNGWFGAITLPLNWLVGIVESHMQSRVGVLEIRDGPWDACRARARFPQGMPPGLDPRRLSLHWYHPAVPQGPSSPR
jgi:hypothetical protein